MSKRGDIRVGRIEPPNQHSLPLCVLRPGIEPGTQGSSIPRSTIELTKHIVPMGRIELPTICLRVHCFSTKLHRYVVPAEGLEPSTLELKVPCSNHWSYKPLNPLCCVMEKNGKNHERRTGVEPASSAWKAEVISRYTNNALV